MKNLLTFPALVASLTLVACGRPATPPTTSTAKNTTRAGAQSLKSKKPANTSQTTQAPKPPPASKSAAGKTVTPRDITQGGQVTVETWSFTDLDLDGDGVGESGVVAVAGEEVAAWWSGTFFVEESQTAVTYDAMLWTENGGVGFIYDYGDSAIACGADASGASACIVCDATGECVVE